MLKKILDRRVLLYFLAFVVVVAIILNYRGNSADNLFKKYTIRYYSYNNVYDISVNDLENAKRIQVVEKTQVQCIKDPCEPIFNRDYTTKYTEAYKLYFKVKFPNTKNRTVIIYEDSASSYDREMLNKIIDDDYTSRYTSYYDYEVLSNSDYFEQPRGFSIYHHYGVEDNYTDTEIEICSGERSSGGYTISIDSMQRYNNNLKIVVVENNPTTDVVTMAITYPTVKVRVPFDVDKIEVTDIYGKTFKQMK